MIFFCLEGRAVVRHAIEPTPFNKCNSSPSCSNLYNYKAESLNETTVKLRNQRSGIQNGHIGEFAL